jgi:hypothetical protein
MAGWHAPILKKGGLKNHRPQLNWLYEITLQEAW